MDIAATLTRSLKAVVMIVLVTSCAVDAKASEDVAWRESHVSTAGHEDGDGTPARPMATIAGAIRAALSFKGPVRIAVEPGTYREGALRITRRDWPLVIESTGPDQVVVSGSDVWTRWEIRDQTIVTDWTEDWGEYDLDAGFPKRDREGLQAAGKRSEMVFVDGVLMTQVTEADMLRAGTFLVDLEHGELLVHLSERKSLDEVLIEIGVRPNLLIMLQAHDVTLRGLTFQHAVAHPGRKASGFEAYAVAIFGEHVSGNTNSKSDPQRMFCERITIEDCRFVFNNRTGLTIANTKHLTARRCQFDDNGITGVGANRHRHVVFEDCTFNRNNWRLDRLGHVYGWGPAGTKHLFADDIIFRGCTFNDNYATGFWMDMGNSNIVARDCEMKRNTGCGLYFEWSPGPMLVEDCDIVGNGLNTPVIDVADGGVLFAEGENLTLRRCRVMDNVNYQIAARPRDRPGIGYWTDEETDGHVRNLTVEDCLIVGGRYEAANVPDFYTVKHRTSTLIGQHVHAVESFYPAFVDTYHGTGNTFHHQTSTFGFSRGGDYGYDRVNLAEWRAITGQDQGSRWTTIRPILTAESVE